MLVVLASRFDKASAALAAEWTAHEGCMMTPDDLSVPGWKDEVGSSDPERSTAVVSGKRVSFGEISGVLVRLPFILEAELGHMVEGDRRYVAAEMTSYLVSWLTRLRCPVLNRPSPMNLLGPGWRIEKWAQTANELGMKVSRAPSRREIQLRRRKGDRRRFSEVNVVGEKVFGTPDPRLSKHVRLLAEAAQVDILTVLFGKEKDEPTFAGVDTWPRIDSREKRDAILSLLLARNRVRISSGSFAS